jgi:integrase
VAVLTARTLNKLTKEPPSTRVDLQDKAVPSLRARVMPSGVVSLTWLRWVGGRPRRVTFGRWPACSLDAARESARRKDLDLAAGLDVVPTRGAVDGRSLLSSIWEAYYEHAKVHHKRPDSSASQWKHLTSLKDRPIGSITSDDVERWHRTLGRVSGQVTANRCLGLFSALYTRAIRSGFRGTNPCKFVTHFAESPRTRVLQGHETAKLLAALEKESDVDVRDFIRLGISTGARRGNLAAMKWSDVDLQAQLWSIAGAESKNGLPMVLPLGADAIEILRRRDAENRETSDFVFPARKANPKYPFQTSWQGRVRRVFDGAKLPDVRFHDLRRSFGTYSLNSGVDLALVSALLGHRQLSTTAAVYAHATAATLRAVVDRTTTHQLAAATASEGMSVRKEA